VSDKSAGELASSNIAELRDRARSLRALGPPALVIPVMTYVGETEDEALERYGVDRRHVGSEVVFIHLN
jgi:hypothetical protein